MANQAARYGTFSVPKMQRNYVISFGGSSRVHINTTRSTPSSSTWIVSYGKSCMRCMASRAIGYIKNQEKLYSFQPVALIRFVIYFFAVL
jgi:hypothetical protein